METFTVEIGNDYNCGPFVEAHKGDLTKGDARDNLSCDMIRAHVIRAKSKKEAVSEDFYQTVRNFRDAKRTAFFAFKLSFSC